MYFFASSHAEFIVQNPADDIRPGQVMGEMQMEALYFIALLQAADPAVEERIGQGVLFDGGTFRLCKERPPIGDVRLVVRGQLILERFLIAQPIVQKADHALRFQTREVAAKVWAGQPIDGGKRVEAAVLAPERMRENDQRSAGLIACGNAQNAVRRASHLVGNGGEIVGVDRVLAAQAGPGGLRHPMSCFIPMSVNSSIREASFFMKHPYSLLVVVHELGFFTPR